MAKPLEHGLDTDIAIETPEHIVFRYKVAGPARRFFAYLIDVVLCYVVLFFIAAVVLLAAAGEDGIAGAFEGTAGLGVGLFLVLLFVVQWVYFVVLEGIWGTTPGKRALGLRVVTTTGRPIDFRAAALRNILRAADSLPLAQLAGLVSVVGLVTMALTRRFQRLGDLVAGTMVIVPQQTHAAAPVALWPPIQPFEEAALPPDVTLDADEREAIDLFLRRRARLGRARELELAKMVAGPLGRRFGFRAEDPSRTLALLYDRAANAGRGEAPASSMRPTFEDQSQKTPERRRAQRSSPWR
jgi:uncharacterized RDD family membrane protein YckC